MGVAVAHALLERGQREPDLPTAGIELSRTQQPHARGVGVAQMFELELARLDRGRDPGGVVAGDGQAPLEEIGEQRPLGARPGIGDQGLDRLRVSRVVAEGAAVELHGAGGLAERALT